MKQGEIMREGGKNERERVEEGRLIEDKGMWK